MSTEPTELSELRVTLETVDAELVRLLGKRLALARAIGTLKRQAGVPVLDPAREAAVVRRAVSLGREMDVPELLVRDLYWRIIAASRELQHSLAAQAGVDVTRAGPESSRK